jgi:hypothetical protein
MQHGSGDYTASAPAGGHYYPHRYALPGPNPYPATDAGAGGYSAPSYSAGGYAEHAPSAPSYAQPASAPSYSQPASAPSSYSQPPSVPTSYSQPPSAPTSYSQPPPQYGEAYPPYSNSAPAPYLPEPYYSYPLPTQPAAPPAPELNPPLLPYDAPYYGGGYQPPATRGYSQPQAAGYDDDYLNEGVYAYNTGSGAEPYGARGTAPARSGSALFDDYGRSISLPSGGEQRQSIGSGGGGSGSFGKIVRAVPKAETREDAGGGAQKFRAKLLPEGTGNPIDVLCQVRY